MGRIFLNSVNSGIIAACPLAFGGANIKEREKV